jgi:hypothetical protein
MSRAGNLIAIVALLASTAAASAQTVGRINSAPLNLGASGAVSRYSRPAPADPISGPLGGYSSRQSSGSTNGQFSDVVQASYYQASSTRASGGPAPINRGVAPTHIASNRTSSAIPIQSLPPAQSVPIYYPMSYTPTSFQQGAYAPAYGAPVGSPYTTRSYPVGAANRAPTLIPTAYAQNCGPTAPTYPIGGAPAPYATAPAAPGARPFLPLTSMPNQVYVSRGLLGQPVVYVPGQPLRNGLRYLTP